MSLTQQALEKITALSDADFTYSITCDTNFIDTLSDDCSAIVMEATVVYFEIKNLQTLLKTGKRLVARVYKIYYKTLQEVCEKTGGVFNCYSPTGFLMIYPQEKYNMSYVVDVALKTADLISVSLRETIEKHCHNNFSMGIDHGNVLGTKTFSDGKSSQIVWFGKTIDKAIAISNLCLKPFYVGLSGTVFHNMDDSMKTTTKSILGIKKQVEVWTKMSYQFDNVKKHLYQTNFHKSFDEED